MVISTKSCRVGSHPTRFSKSRFSRTECRHGIVLVVVLWVLVILAILTVALARRTRLDNAIRIAAADRTVARWLARAGVQRAIAEIAGDTSPADGPSDSWYDDEKLFRQVELSGGTFSLCADRFYDVNRCAYGIIDEAGKINLNTAPYEVILALPEMTETLASAIIEWRNRSRESQDNERPDITEQERMSAMSAKSGTIRTIRELGLISEEATREMLYGEDDNLNGILEANENDGDETLPLDNRDNTLDRGLLAYVTVYSYERNQDGLGRKRININTADKSELEKLLGIETVHANWIVENRPYLNSIADLIGDDAELMGTKETAITDTFGTGEEKDAESIRPTIEVFRRIADRMTITNIPIIPGRVNINTASEVVLRTLPGMNEQIAAAAVQTRQGLENGFSGIAEILTVTGMSVTQFRKMAGMITVRSNVFTIRSFGRAERTGIQHSVEAVVSRGQARPKILYWKENR
ncbi:MAG: helix-hairpin-helix domain-containing protein [Sedimentisphaerales bacterium]|nr:helix-hairpin-helix domain-containing protein [Sedimentisphaerales bacterium]